ncbi:outer membrane protein assembly factor BamE [Luteimonas sp. MC1782]|uniref:outer membrane protein assembly factor BamE n=1 Tax=Luteimonas sp. MC1782 TaxID=2760305 RepID=UPI0015FEDEAA|nr:outer membrane protein assembly factor BamE [Luteimonas sp. MC1782]MBB1471934.1 outer membrane protein assembly factor BamE [Luteimonas sp. MC1782]
MRKLLVPVIVACLATGCGLVYKQPIYQGNLLKSSDVAQLQAGMNRQQVSALLGTPSVQDPFHQERWDYTASERTGRIGKTEVHNLTLWFEGDTLAKWEGDQFPDRDAEMIKDVRRSFGPNLARDKKKTR